MFIDINAYVGHWPFRQLVNNTLADLDREAQERGITHMVIANIEGLFFKDSQDANFKLLEDLKTYSGKTVFLPLAVVNPTYPEWEREARAMIDAGFKGFEISPQYHLYSYRPQIPDDTFVTVHHAAKVIKLAAELDVPVRVCVSFENYRARSNHESHENPGAGDIQSLMSVNQETHLLVTSFNAVAVSDAAKARSRTYFDFTANSAGAINTRTCESLANLVSDDQICYGSLAPLQYFEPTLLAMEYDVLNAEKAKINAARAFKDLR